jgi:hypothetical protein
MQSSSNFRCFYVMIYRADLGSGGAAGPDRLAVVGLVGGVAAEAAVPGPAPAPALAVVVVSLACRRGPLMMPLLVAAAGRLGGRGGVPDEAGPGERLRPPLHPRGADLGEVQRVVRRRGAAAALPAPERGHRRPRRPPLLLLPLHATMFTGLQLRSMHLLSSCAQERRLHRPALTSID